MTVYRFQEVTHRVQRRVPCSGCGKKLTRSRTFMNTINPFNKNEAGVPKTWSEVVADVKAAAEAWQPTDVRCSGCEVSA